jgi:PhnB protein
MAKLNPYINFKDNARGAMEFYKAVFGGKLTINTFKEFHAPVEESEADLVMHSVLEADNGLTFMASDTPTHMKYEPGRNVSMSLSGENEDELRGYWEKLSEDAAVEQALEKAPWGDTFGMLTDKFGIHWLVNITGKKE